jgi:hypothetical protein
VVAGVTARDDSRRTGRRQREKAVRLPEPDESVIFGAHTQPLACERDRQSTSVAFDLRHRDDVVAHADAIPKTEGAA